MDDERQGSSPTKRVLLVDDDPLGRKLAAMRLRAAGFVVETAHTAEEALVLATGSPPDAIVSDIRMPGMDGFQFCQAIRRDARLGRIPVVLLSAVAANARDQQRATDLSASCLVRTPDLQEVIEALATVVDEE